MKALNKTMDESVNTSTPAGSEVQDDGLRKMDVLSALSDSCESVQNQLQSAFGAAHQNPAMFAGIGVDLANVERIQQAVERGDGAGEAFIEKAYYPAEVAYCRSAHFPSERFAALWAVREAAVKALGTGYADGVGFHDLEILCEEGQAPRLQFHGRFAEIAAERGIRDSRVTLSHDRNYVVAVVVLLKPGDEI